MKRTYKSGNMAMGIEHALEYMQYYDINNVSASVGTGTMHML